LENAEVAKTSQLNVIKTPFAEEEGYTPYIEHSFLTFRMKFQTETRTGGGKKQTRLLKNCQRPSGFCTWPSLGALRPDSGHNTESL